MKAGLTKEALEKREDILASDKALIEEAVREDGGGYKESPDIPLRQAIRGYLVQQMEESEVDDQLREDLAYSAASFADGWGAALEYQQKSPK